MQPTIHKPQRASDRAGFTMVELLVVITIIAILMSISIAVYNDSLENARVSATRATIRQIDGALQDRIDAFARLNLRSQAVQFQAAFNTTYAPLQMPLKVAETIIHKDRFRAAFPQRVEDLWGLSGNPTVPDNSPLWRVWMQETGATAMVPRPGVITSDIESAVLLHLTLTRGSFFGLPAASLDGINSRYIRTIETYMESNGTQHTVSYFVDDWEQPIRFYNWPTRLIRYNGELSYMAPPVGVVNDGISAPAFLATAGVLMPRAPEPPPATPVLPFNYFSHPLNQDPDDQFGALTAYLDAPGGGPILRGTFNLTYPVGIIAAQPIDQNLYHTLDTYHSPLIVSGGPDNRTGLVEPNGFNSRTNTTDFTQRLAMPLGDPLVAGDREYVDQLNDNITNRQ